MQCVKSSSQVREVRAGTTVSLPAGFEIRAPRTDEIEQLIDIHLALPAHQQRSPVFSGIRLARAADSGPL